jgi:hypothetical protein
VYEDSDRKIQSCVNVIAMTTKRINEIKKDMFDNYIKYGLGYDSESMDEVLYVNLEMKIQAKRKLEILENGGMV